MKKTSNKKNLKSLKSKIKAAIDECYSKVNDAMKSSGYTYRDNTTFEDFMLTIFDYNAPIPLGIDVAVKDHFISCSERKCELDQIMKSYEDEIDRLTSKLNEARAEQNSL